MPNYVKYIRKYWEIAFSIHKSPIAPFAVALQCFLLLKQVTLEHVFEEKPCSSFDSLPRCFVIPQKTCLS